MWGSTSTASSWWVRECASLLTETATLLSTGYCGLGTKLSTVSLLLQNSFFAFIISMITFALISTSANSLPFLQRSRRTTLWSLISTSVSTKEVVVHLMPFFQRVQACWRVGQVGSASWGSTGRACVKASLRSRT